MDLQEIFYKGIKNIEKESPIKQVQIDWNVHARGITHIANTHVSNFEVTAENKPILKLLLLYFTGNPDFEIMYQDIFLIPGSLDKGIMLIGGTGTGKTTLFKIFKDYTAEIIQTNSFRIYNTIDIVRDTAKNGMSEIEEFGIRKDGRHITCYVDDISSNIEDINNFGTKFNVMEQFFTLRYNLYQRHRLLTHVSTNKYPKELSKIYDPRIIDRFAEMFNFVEVPGKSFRKIVTDPKNKPVEKK